MAGKRIQFDSETLHALNVLGQDTMMTFQELADEAFRDLLKKHGRPDSLRKALRASVEKSEKSDKIESGEKKSADVVPIRRRNDSR